MEEERYERKLDARLVLSVAATGIMSCAGVIVETSMNIAFPSLMEEFGVTTSTVQWITTGYLLVLAAIIPLSAFLKRRFTTKTLFVSAILLFTAGTVACAAAPSFAMLLAGRIVQGVGTGLALPLMFNIVIEQAPQDKMGLMMGVATLITAIAPALGPSLGGFVIGMAGWRMIFIVLLPVLVLSFFLGVFSIRQVTPTQRATFSVPQFLALACGFACLVFAINTSSSTRWPMLVAAIALIALFCIMANRSDNPLIRVGIFKERCFTLSVAYVVLVQSIALATSYLIPNFAQISCDFGEFAAGCLMLPGCVVGAILSPFGGRILDALGAKRPILIGATSILVALVLFVFVGVAAGAIWLAFFNVFISVGQGFSMSNSITNGLSYLPEQLKADGNAAFNTLQQLGGAIGTAVATSVVNAAQAGATDMALATTIGAQHAFYVLGVIALTAFFCAVAVFAKQKARHGEQGSSGVRKMRRFEKVATHSTAAARTRGR